MLRWIVRRCGSDSPYRHGTRVQVSKHIQDKRFGNDVLLFAEPAKLKREAMLFIQDPSQHRPKAFWEILAKRTNESVHLLNYNALSSILRAMVLCPECDDLIVGVCRVVCEDIENRRDLTTRQPVFSESLFIAETVRDRLGEIPAGTMDSFVSFWADNAQQIDCTDDIKRLVRILDGRSSSVSPSPVEQILFKKLLHKWNGISKNDTSVPAQVPFSLLLDTVNNS